MNLWSAIVTAFTLALTVHGIGHIMGILESWGVVRFVAGANPGGLLGRIGAGGGVTRIVGLLFAVAIVGYLAVAYGFWQGLDWWRPVAMSMSAMSLGLFGLWWNTMPSSNQTSAVIFDTVIIATAYFWPR